MGTLHEVYQLQPKVITDGAILPLKKNARDFFLKNYPKKNDSWWLFSNTFAIDSPDGKVQRIAMYSGDRVIDFCEPSIYIAIQSGSKYGFCDTFEQHLKRLSPLLEDALFYVIWDNLMTKFEIRDDALTIHKAKNFNHWNYNFIEYLKDAYKQYPQILAQYYVDEIIELQIFYEDLLTHNDNVHDCFDEEDCEAYLSKIKYAKKYLFSEKTIELENWLKKKLVSMPKNVD